MLVFSKYPRCSQWIIAQIKKLYPYVNRAFVLKYVIFWRSYHAVKNSDFERAEKDRIAKVHHPLFLGCSNMPPPLISAYFISPLKAPTHALPVLQTLTFKSAWNYIHYHRLRPLVPVAIMRAWVFWHKCLKVVITSLRHKCFSCYHESSPGIWNPKLTFFHRSD